MVKQENFKNAESKKAVEAVQEFLDREGITLKVFPEFKPRDDGTFSVVVRAFAEYKNPANELS